MLCGDGFLQRMGLRLGRRCAVCGAQLDSLTSPFPHVCQACSRELVLRTGGYCPGCGLVYSSDLEDVYLCTACRHDPEPWSHIGFFAPYEGIVKTLIREYKFRSALDLGRVLGEMLGRAFVAHGLKQPDIILPVPLHPRRLQERGYNQCLELARHLVPVSGGLLVPEGLARIRHTKTQSGLGRKARLTNLANAFAAQPHIVDKKNVLLVDDVLTTGTTLRTCARAVLGAGAVRVDVLVLARA